MRQLSDEDLAKYFDDAPAEGAAKTAPKDGWSLDDAFANPKRVRTEAPVPGPSSRLKRPSLADRPLHPVRPVSRVSNLPPLSDEGLTWTGRDTQPVRGGNGNKMMVVFVAALGACALFVYLSAG